MVENKAAPLLSLGAISGVRYRYPVLDPLKVLLPRRNITWPGSPDLQYDYYSGRSRDGNRWLREVSIEYHLYKVTAAE